MPFRTRSDADRFPNSPSTNSPTTDVGNGFPVWAVLAVRVTSACLCVAVFLQPSSAGRSVPSIGSAPLSKTPLRAEAQVYSMLGESPIVALPGLPLRLFGVEIRQPGQILPGDWLGDWPGDSIGDMISGEPVTILLPYSEFTDEQMPLIAQAHALRRLSLDGTRITDEGLRHLIGLKFLETLSIGDNDITDQGAEQLGRMASLKHLDLRGTRLTGAAFESLARLPLLEALNLSRTALDAEQLASLRLLVNLRSLRLDGVSLDDDDVAVLGTVKPLCRLHLRGTRVTQAGVAKLAALIPLEYCEIEGAIFNLGDLDALRTNSDR